MMDSKRAMELMEELNPEALKIDGFDECIVGVVYTFHGAIFLYDSDKIVEQMISDDKIEGGEALEYFEYNILGAYMGLYTPVYMSHLDEEL